MSNAIKDVLGAEREADEVLAKAHRDQEAQILEAKQKAMQLLETGKARVDAEMDAKLQQHRVKLDREREQILRDAAEQAQQLERKAKAKLANVTEGLLRKFTQRVG